MTAMSGVVIWMGPVSTVNLKSVVLPPDWSVLTVSCEMLGKPSCPTPLTPTDFRSYAASLGSDPLGALMAKAGSPEHAVLASFSAGHGLLDPLLNANAGDPRIQGVYAADSYYGLDVKPGYKRQADAAIAAGPNGPPFWLSTSSAKGGVTIHSGSESMAVFAGAEALVDVDPPTGMPKPVTSKGLGSCLWLDYQALYAHQEHATLLCPTALNLWFSGATVTPIGPGVTPGPGASPLSLFGSLVAVGLGGAAGYYAARWAERRWG